LYCTLLPQPKLLLGFFFKKFKACLGVVLKSFWSRVILAFYLIFWISISNSDGVICEEALLWTVCPLLTVRNKKRQCSVQGERFAVEVLMILLGLGIPSIWSFYLCWIIKTFKSTSVVKMRSSVSPKKEKL
jgi:hypothetical protein